MEFDYIIVGGGSAGSVLANRLSARSANTVLVCEAGEDTPPGAVPAEILDSYPGTAYLNNRFLWSELKVSTEVVSHNRDPNAPPPKLRKYEQARVLGGGSSVNGQMANRGAPTDFDDWHERGATGWKWENVLPYFKKLERDLDITDDWHGHDGPIPVRRVPKSQWPGHAKALAEAFGRAGYKYLADQNGHFEDGYFPITISNANEQRVSAAIGYLDADVRKRANLTISTRTQVTGLLFEDRQCVGVKALVAGRPTEFRGREVILSSGAIHSPAHLLRAGIGPAGHLRDLGIPVRHALFGVGQRLMDHPSIALASFLKPHARVTNKETRRHLFVAMRYSSGIGGAPPGDMFVVGASKTSWHKVGEQIASFILFVNKTYSETGQVRLASRDPSDEPEVEFNLLSDRRDLERIADGIKRLAPLYRDPAMQGAMTDPFPASYSDKVRQVGEINAKNRLLTGIMARLLDGPGFLRRLLIQNLIMEGFTLEDVINDEEQAEAFIRKAAVGVWHASCTCRMGAQSDPMAVTDPAGRVRGIGGLRVVDASIFPVVPCANTNLPTIMTAEKISDMIIEALSAGLQQRSGTMTLTLADANRVIAGATAKAIAIGAKMNIAVCDAGGRLVAFQRMDGAMWAGSYGSQGKAVASAAFGRPSGDLTARAEHPTLRGIVMAEGGHMFLGQGAVPLFRAAVLVGACGVGGGTAQEDEDCARAGAEKL